MGFWGGGLDVGEWVVTMTMTAKVYRRSLILVVVLKSFLFAVSMPIAEELPVLVCLGMSFIGL